MDEAPSKTTRLSAEAAGRLMKRATYASVTVATLLIIAKFFAWQASGAVSLLATLVDSVLDALASLVNLLAVRHAVSPADREHRFGHGKAEAIAGLAQALLISGSALFLVLEAVRRLTSPVPLESFGLGALVMLFSIGLTLLLLAYQRRVVRLTGSTAIQADALHYRSDLLVNGSVLLALALSMWGWSGFDSLFAIAIAVYILYCAWEILQQAFEHLMDRELPDAERDEIKRIARAHPQVRGLHDLRSRRAGTATFIQLHLELDDELSLLQAHSIADAVEAQLLAAFPAADVLIHCDPMSVVGREVKQDLAGD